jgi:PTS system cellobiose-specific IIA component
VSEEQVIMLLIMHGGDARSASLKAIQAAESGAFDQAELFMNQAKESLGLAHEAQTKVIQEEIRGKSQKVGLLMVHAQDHVMNAMTVKELAEHLIRCQQQLQLLEGNL